MWWKISGTEYHLEDKDSFFSIVTADSAQEAIKQFLNEEIGGDFDDDELDLFFEEFNRTGQIVDREIWLGDDKIFAIHSVIRTLFGEETCPHCDGKGTVASYIPY